MGEITGERKFIFSEEVKYKAGVSSSTGFKIGKMLNFLGRKTYNAKRFDLDGPYFIVADPQLGVEIDIFEFDAEIFNVWIYSQVPGTSGTTELDLKIATTPGGSFTSIFTTTPKISSAAIPYAWLGVGDTLAGCTAPVLSASPVLVTAKSLIRIDKLDSMVGGENAALIVHYRNR